VRNRGGGGGGPSVRPLSQGVSGETLFPNFNCGLGNKKGKGLPNLGLFGKGACVVGKGPKKPKIDLKKCGSVGKFFKRGKNPTKRS